MTSFSVRDLVSPRMSTVNWSVGSVNFRTFQYGGRKPNAVKLSHFSIQRAANLNTYCPAAGKHPIRDNYTKWVPCYNSLDLHHLYRKPFKYCLKLKLAKLPFHVSFCSPPSAHFESIIGFCTTTHKSSIP
jgi:hypothetical protein